MKQEAENIDLDLLEKSVVETGLPCYLLLLMAQAATSKGYVLRADTQKRLNTGAAAPIAALAAHPARVSRAAKRMEDTARRMLYDLSPDDPVHGLYCCAQFALKLVDEGYLDDPTNMGVIVALMLIEELKADSPPDGIRVTFALLNSGAYLLLRKAQKDHGLYNLTLPPKALGNKPLPSPA